MDFKNSTFIILIVCLSVFSTVGCKPPPAWSQDDINAIVASELVTIYSPAPSLNGVHPKECDYITYLRFRAKDPAYPNGVVPMDKLDAVMLCMPGLGGGANIMRHVSEQWVYMAKKIKNANIEVWVIDERSGTLEDLTGMNAAEDARNVDIAIDYYFRGKAVQGKVFGGFLNPKEIRFLSDFGFSIYMKDIYTIITTNMPDQNMRKQKLYLVGHCMGGFFLHVVAGWDFDGNPATTADAGYNNFAGLVNLDGVIGGALDLLKKAVNVIPAETIDTIVTNVMKNDYGGLITSMRTGYFPVVANQIVAPVGGQLYSYIEMAAMEADFAPEAESTLLKRVPYSINLETVLRVMFSKDLDHFLSGTPSIKDIRMTNEALLGLLFDNQSQFINSLQVGLGFIYGGEIVEKKFPFTSADINMIPGFEGLTRLIISKNPLYLPSDAGSLWEKGPLYRWMKFDQVPEVLTDSAGTVLTTAIQENSDIHAAAKAIYKGPINFIQWYYPLRLLVDLFAVNLNAELPADYGLSFFYKDGSSRLPKLEIINDRGPFYDTLKDLGWDMTVAEGYHHGDSLFAACNRHDRRDCEMGLPVLDFVLGK
jgi:hypothetical protein